MIDELYTQRIEQRLKIEVRQLSKLMGTNESRLEYLKSVQRARAFLTIALIAFPLSLVQAEMPFGFAAAMNNAGAKDVLAVRNYETGAALTEEYTDFEHLERETAVTTRTGASPSSSSSSSAISSGGLQASINSNVIGKAHISWQSYDPAITVHGRHPLIGRSVEDLTGVFSIEKFVQLWSNSSPGEISVDWLPCC